MNWLKQKITGEGGAPDGRRTAGFDAAGRRTLAINPYILEAPQITPQEQQRIRREHVERTERFNSEALSRGCGGIEELVWYHTIDLGGGLLTPGIFDYRNDLDAFQFPERMQGMTALDAGSGTGFFAFELARRGAEVTSVDAASLADFDYLPGVNLKRAVSDLIAFEHLWDKQKIERVFSDVAADELDRIILRRPFEFCQRVLGAQVRRVYCGIYELDARALGREKFDCVFLGNVLLHLQNPLKALAAVAPLCGGSLTILQPLPHVAEERPCMVYQGGGEWADDNITWWLPNVKCFEQLLRKVGFKSFEVIGGVTGITQTIGIPYSQTIIRAWK